MKLSIKTPIKSMLVLGALVPFFVPFFTFAEINVTLHRDVEALVVNGESLPMSVLGKKRFILPDGANQLVVRVSKLVESGSEFEKFKTDPLVISFDTSDVNFTISSARKIHSERQIKDFKENPSFQLVSNTGKDVIASQEILPAGPGLLRDYEKELLKFNQKRRGNSGQNALAYNQNRALPENRVILMQADFLRMNQKDKQTFLDWAAKNVNF